MQQCYSNVETSGLRRALPEVTSTLLVMSQTNDVNSVELTSFFKRPADSFAEQLRGPTKPEALPHRWGLMLILVLICLLPRAWMAIRCDAICADAVTYMKIADSVERGNLRVMTRSLGMNTYPAILIALRKTGFEWTTVNELWSVAMAVLTVFPLFGWVRRQFDDQVAAFACVMYAIHPMMSIISSWIIRDPTFWFLFNLSLYLIWRSIVEIRLPLFIATGLALTLTIHTRSEGWLLIIPLTLWTAWRLRFVPGSRRRLIVGTVCALLTIPLVVSIIRPFIFEDNQSWQLSYSVPNRPIKAIKGFVQNFQQGSFGVEAETASEHPTVDLNESRNLPILLRVKKLVNRFIKSFTYIYVLLVAIGLVVWRRVFFRFDQQVLFLENIVLFVEVVRRCNAQISGEHRYFATLVFLCMPYLALGLLKMADWLSSFWQVCFRSRKQPQLAFIVALLVVVAASGMYRCCNFENLRAKQVDLGHWILNEIGPGRRICGSIPEMRLVGYYSKGIPRAHSSQQTYRDQPVLDAIEEFRPHILLLWNDWKNFGGLETYRKILDRQDELGFRQVDQNLLPESCREILVLLREDEIAKWAKKSR